MGIFWVCLYLHKCLVLLILCQFFLLFSCFVIFWFLWFCLILFYFIISIIYIHVHSLKRDEKEMDPDWKRGGKKLEGIWGGEILFRIYHIKFIFNEIKKIETEREPWSVQGWPDLYRIVLSQRSIQFWKAKSVKPEYFILDHLK